MVAKRSGQRNVLGGALKMCSLDPLTGFTRSGSCEGHEEDFGCHAVCAQVTEEFLQFGRIFVGGRLKIANHDSLLFQK